MRQPHSASSTSATKSLFLMGRDSHGNWVVQDQECRCGGLFVDRTAALKFAMFENGNKPRAVVMVPGVFELAFNGAAERADNQNANVPARARRAA